MISKNKNVVDSRQAPRRIGLRLGLVLGRLGYGSAKFPDQVVAFGKQRIDTALALGDIWPNVELAIHPHVVNRIELLPLVPTSLVA